MYDQDIDNNPNLGEQSPDDNEKNSDGYNDYSTINSEIDLDDDNDNDIEMTNINDRNLSQQYDEY